MQPHPDMKAAIGGRRDACPACGGAVTAPAAAAAPSADTIGSSRKRAGRIHIARCARCGLAWQDPLPTARELEAVYAGLQDDRRVAEEAGRRRVYRWYLDRLCGYAGAPRGRVLDVGCATGGFLELAEQAGWDVMGLEPSSWLAAPARARWGERIVISTLEKADLEEGRFRAVTFWDVLEHLEDPAGALRRASRALAPGGIVGLNVPDIGSLPARCMRSRWPLLLPEHTFYFTRRALRALFGREGLAVLGFLTHASFFTAGFVAERLRQHGFPGAAAAGRLLARLKVDAMTIPVFMGDVTAFARKAA